MKEYLVRAALSVAMVLVSICYPVPNAYAQTNESLLRLYNNETIHTFGRYYVKGSKQLKFQELKSEFSSGVTKDLYKKSKWNLGLSKLFTITSIASLVTGALIKKNNNGGAIALSAVGIGLNLGSLHFRRQYTEIIDRAIWQRNKEVLFGVQQ